MWAHVQLCGGETRSTPLLTTFHCFTSSLVSMVRQINKLRITRFFPAADVVEEEQGNDWLYTVIADIVSAHNAFIESLYSIVTSQEQSPLARLLPEQAGRVYTTEVNDNHCIVGRFNR